VLTANLDGSVGIVAPLWLEHMVPPLRALQTLLELKIRQPAGLNPRAYRSPPLPHTFLPDLLGRDRDETLKCSLPKKVHRKLLHLIKRSNRGATNCKHLVFGLELLVALGTPPPFFPWAWEAIRVVTGSTNCATSFFSKWNVSDECVFVCRERFRKIPKPLGGGVHRGPPPPSRTIVDGDLLWMYQYMPHSQQVALAQKVGMEQARLLSLLDEIAQALDFL